MTDDDVAGLCARLRGSAAGIGDRATADMALHDEAATAIERLQGTTAARWWNGQIKNMRARAEAAEARIAELERDAARWRFCVSENQTAIAAIAWRYPDACAFSDAIQAVDAAIAQKATGYVPEIRFRTKL